MTWDDGTGEGVKFQTRSTRDSDFTYESVSGDRWAPGFETSGNRSTGMGQQYSGEKSKKNKSDGLRRIPAKAIQRRRLCLQACIEELGEARMNEKDPIIISNCLSHVKDNLQMLWEYLEGDAESESFEELVNVLQIALSDFTNDGLLSSQGEVIISVLNKLHTDPDIDNQTANELTEELIRGGIDVFREVG